MNRVRRLGNTRLIALFGVFALMIIGLLWWSFSLVPKTSVKNRNVACTAEAKLCPDGSSVGRSGPNCEFGLCPGLSSTNRATDGCVITGCSGQLCDEREIITTCEARPDKTCYSSATCARQVNGKCGWTVTADLERCLQRTTNQSDNSNSETGVIPTFGQGDTCVVYTTRQGKIRYCSTCGDGKCDPMERCVALDTSGYYLLNSCGPLFCPADCESNTNTNQ